jgi:hypothetical protein
MNNKTILETLKLQPLTEEEKQRRHILGRWYGPIATCNEGTRNGRRYNRELWEKALNDELFHEKIANKCLFLELGHPQDREETDMSKVCACIPEMPRIIDGDLCACVDILDTPNGRILKTLCDYGFIPGVSSRGSGDVMPNNDVDPETFFLETFDCVAIPAVKKARLTMCESLDTEGLKLKKALTESFNKASEEDKVIMKETLDNLNIDIEENISEEPVEEPKKALTADDIPWSVDEDEILVEEMPAEEDDTDKEETSEEETDVSVEEPAEESEEADESEAVEEESSEEVPEDSTIDVTGKDELDVNNVGDVVELLQEFDDETPVEFEVTQPDGETAPADEIEQLYDEEQGVLVFNVKSCDSPEEDLDDADSNIEQETEEETSVETIEEVDDDSESAEDVGDEEVIESLKEMVRQKEALETEVSDLRKAKSVGDAKEHELQEQLQRYRTAFKTTSAEAARVPELEAKVKELTEMLTKSQNNVKTLTEKVKKAQQLKESIEGNKANERRLTEEVSRLTKKSETLEAKLEGQTKVYTEKLQERTQLAKNYKARFIETLNKYVKSKADMLGIAPSEITSRLNETYTLKDVDAVCDQILESTVNFSRLPFGGRTKTSARITESISKTRNSYDEDDLSDLYQLAGLKKYKLAQNY